MILPSVLTGEIDNIFHFEKKYNLKWCYVINASRRIDTRKFYVYHFVIPENGSHKHSDYKYPN